MIHKFPKKEHYSNPKIMLDKNLLKRLLRLNEINSELNNNKKKFNNNLKSVFPDSHKTYPQNVFKKDDITGICEACNNRGRVKKVYITRKSVFQQLYSTWSFLKFHPLNITFLCNDCRNMFENRFKHNSRQLSKTKFNTLKGNINKRIKRIKKAMKSDKKYLQTYKLKPLLKKYNHIKPTSYMDAIRIFWAKEKLCRMLKYMKGEYN